MQEENENVVQALKAKEECIVNLEKTLENYREKSDTQASELVENENVIKKLTKDKESLENEIKSKHQEISKIRENVNEALAKNKMLIDDRSLLEKRISEMNEQCAKLQVELTETIDKKMKNEERIKELLEIVAEYENKWMTSTKQINTNETEIILLKERQLVLQKLNDELLEERNDNKRMIADEKEKSVQLEAQLMEKTNKEKRTEERIQELMQKVADYEFQMENSSKQMNDNDNQVAVLKGMLSSLGNENENLRRESKALRSENEKVKRTITEEKKRYNKLQGDFKHKAQKESKSEERVEELLRKISELENKMENSARQLEGKNRDISAVEERLQAVLKEKEHLQSENNYLRSENNKIQENILHGQREEKPNEDLAIEKKKLEVCLNEKKQAEASLVREVSQLKLQLAGAKEENEKFKERYYSEKESYDRLQTRMQLMEAEMKRVSGESEWHKRCKKVQGETRAPTKQQPVKEADQRKTVDIPKGQPRKESTPKKDPEEKSSEEEMFLTRTTRKSSKRFPFDLKLPSSGNNAAETDLKAREYSDELFDDLITSISSQAAALSLPNAETSVAVESVQSTAKGTSSQVRNIYLQCRTFTSIN
ncbi:synaptonemal complex protein 1 [Orussus abietinus]|uniref:synaptonemal complex protein 1 n=1 Tax=Orussus abietinus TaxID=222816 RepID=UPI000625454A|nr:synaptonemal complex protein 1 [Orussus abietinus]